MKYIVSISLVASLLALGLNLHTKYYQDNPITNKIVTIDSDRVIEVAMEKIKNNQFASSEEIYRLGKNYKDKIRGTLDKYAKDNNVVILDKRSVLNNNLKDLTDEFISTFLN